MAEERVQRRLAAILAADVVGYSRFMETDPVGTVARLKALRNQVFEPLTARFGGRIFKTMGDGFLVEFPSAFDAVQGALEVQRELATRNADLSAQERIELRIGISLGDVIIEGDDLYGNGVNVAVRMEGLAPPGGICISSNVYEHVRTDAEFGFEDMGEQLVKNIDRPIQAWQLRVDAPTGKASGPSAMPLSDKPSIAVLPFTNMSGDPSQDYFVDGLAEEIITELSRFRWFFVVARNSSFAYKGRAVDVRLIGRQLGVRYVLEGGVRKSGDRLRITTQLIETATGNHLWAEKFDGQLADVFDLQDKITEGVVGAIEPSVRGAEIERASRKRPENLDAYDLYLRALAHPYYSEAENQQAVEFLRKAIKLDPHYANAYGLAALCIFWQKASGWTPPTDPTIADGIQMAKVAAAEARNEPQALWMAGAVMALLGGDLTGGLALIERSLSINPNSANACTFGSIVHAYSGDDKRAIALCERSMRLSPHDPFADINMVAFAIAHFMADRFDQAAAWCDKALQIRPDYPAALRWKAAACGLLGRDLESGHAVQHLHKVSPDETVATLTRYYAVPMQKPGYLNKFIGGLRKAGMPE